MSLDLIGEFKTRPFHVSYMGRTVKNIIDSLPLAIKREENFWTVGSASYKDRSVRTKHEYEKFVADKNGQLINIFPDFYRFQLQYFSYLLNAKVEYMPNVSIPGFHAFKYCPEYEKPLARPHVDVPFNQFDWGKRVGYHTIFTHVVPVEIPERAGMWVWNYRAEDIDQKGLDWVKAKVEAEKPHATVYHEVDQMVFHSGAFVHQIKPFESGQDDTWRITLQSHAVQLDDTWYLYW